MSGSASLDEIVRAAEQLPPAGQLDYLQRTCGQDAALYDLAVRAVQSRSSGGWWNQNIDLAPDQQCSDAAAAIVGTRIGPYRAVKRLGEGGMGEVLLAERADDSFSQRVAIKLVRRGITSRQVQGRLKLERQILATLDHPNIAKLLDGGTTAEGVPYIVMEYIDGVPIDQYCDARKLDIEARIRLFQVVCSAVHYAHQNLIVHRDLKPSNILISPEGIPKLLDFGIAKVLDERPFGHTLAVTHADYRLLTPDHASPEQVRGEPVTTASDIYVLGVLLYELLTGHKPFSTATSRLSDLEQAICELPPLALYALFQSGSRPPAGVTVGQICESRSTTAARLKRQLSGDLNNIVLMALRKEPERRYASVEQLAADLGRYLTNMPIAARSDSIGYRAGKFLQRHVFGVSVAALAILALVSFAGLTALQAQRIERERIKADQVASFLTELFERSNPSQSRGKDITVREILDVGAARIERAVQSEPETGASLLTTIGTVYTNLGEYDRAIAMLERAVAIQLSLYGERRAEVAQSRQRLGEALLERRDFSKAEAQLVGALRTDVALFGERSAQSAACMHSLGRLRQMQERFGESRDYFERSLQFFNANADAYFDDLTVTLNDYAILLNYVGDVAAAQGIFERVLQLDQRRYGADHPETTTAMNNLAVALEQQGKLAEARPYFTESLAMHRRVFGAASPQYVAALSSYGRFLRRSRELPEAERVLREAIALRRQTDGTDHYMVGYSIVNLAMVLLDQGRAAEAQRESAAALQIYERTLPRTHLYVAAALRTLGLALLDQGKPDQAEAPLREALRIQEGGIGKENPQTALARAALGGALLGRRQYAEAEPLLLKSYAVLAANRGMDEVMIGRLRGWIQTLFVRTGREELAAPYVTGTPAAATADVTP